MEIHETAEGTALVNVRRRTVLKGAAWTAPAVMVLGTTRAYADSPTFNEIAQFVTQGNQAAFVVSGTGVSGQSVSMQVTAPGYTTQAFSGTVVDGSWTLVMDLGAASVAAVAQGAAFTFTPTIGGTDSSPNSRTATKDTVAVVSVDSLANGTGQNTALLSGTLESSVSPSFVQVEATAGGVVTAPTFGATSLALPGWSKQFNMTVNESYRFWIRAVDSLGNVNIYNTSAFTYRNNATFATPTLTLHS